MPWQAGLNPVPLYAAAESVTFYKGSQRLDGFAHHPSISEALHDTS
jgi:hypothetical protein